MKIGDLIKSARDKNLGRKGLKKRIRNLKKSDYGKNWQTVDDEFYDDIGIIKQRPLLHENFLTYIRSLENVRTVLEVGCGMGIYPIKFKDLFENKEYLGMDIGQPAINFCKDNSEFGFICGDLLKTEFNKKFDLIFSHAVIDHVYDIDAFVAKIMSLSKKYVYISAYRGFFPNLDEHKMTWDNEKGCYYNDLSVTKLKNKLLEFGLDESEFLIRKQADGMKLNQAYSIGLDGYETIIEIKKNEK